MNLRATVFAATFAIAAAALVGAAAAQGVSERKFLTLDGAKQIAAAASAEAVKNKWNVVIAIVDEGGQLVYLEKIDNTQSASVDIAIGKARTAAQFRRPTKAMEDAVAGGRNVVMTFPRIVPVQGGLPLKAGDTFIGAIGVSGVASAQDEQVAKAGVDALK